MPSAITHALTGLVLGRAFFKRKMPLRFWGWAALLPVVPDLDVIGFAFGVSYGDFLGHRGFFHSLLFAFLLAFLPWWVLRRDFPGWGWSWRMLLFFFAIAASHGIQDTLTDGGLGIALLSPFDQTRYFFPWTPIVVSPIGVRAFFSLWGLKVIVTEAVFVWLPLAVAFGLIRRLQQRAASRRLELALSPAAACGGQMDRTSARCEVADNKLRDLDKP